MFQIMVSLTLLLLSPLSWAEKFMPDAQYQACFTPYEDCTSVIVSAINQAKKEILVQAYSFTSASIARALVNAHKRGVVVKIILDKSQFDRRRFSMAKVLTNYKIPTWVDAKVSIAHSKIILIDQKIVITGSFNFTQAAQHRNSENVIIISDYKLAQKYQSNWLQRMEQSQAVLPTGVHEGSPAFNEQGLIDRR